MHVLNTLFYAPYEYTFPNAQTLTVLLSTYHLLVHVNAAAMVASGSATSSMNQCVSICATAAFAVGTVAAVLMRTSEAGGYRPPSGPDGGQHIGEGGGGATGDNDASHPSTFILQPIVLLALVVGASYPFAFSSMLFQAAGKVASSVICDAEVQLTRSPEILDPFPSSLMQSGTGTHPSSSTSTSSPHTAAAASSSGHRMPEYSQSVLMAHHKVGLGLGHLLSSSSRCLRCLSVLSHLPVDDLGTSPGFARDALPGPDRPHSAFPPRHFLRRACLVCLPHRSHHHRSGTTKP